MQDYSSTNLSPLPAPTGEFRVGTKFHQWIDESRDEPFIEDPNAKRILSTWIYYPAEIEANAERMPYIMHEADIPGIRFFVSDVFKCDFAGVFSVISQWKSNAYSEANLLDAKDTYPVVIWSSPGGSSATRSLHMTELASHGFIVINLLHTYGYPMELISGADVKIGDFITNFYKLMRFFVADIQALIDRLELTNEVTSGNKFAGKLDLDRIGVIGASISGGIAREIVRLDKRVITGICHDSVFGELLPKSVQHPIMYTNLSIHPEQYYSSSKSPAYLLHFEGLKHNSVCDWIFWPSLQELPELQDDSITNVRVHELLTTYNLAFFDKYLKGYERPLLDGSSNKYPEVRIESLNTN